ncbi:MAG: putative phage abortive infection protein [Alistipes sp.]|jgi:hypothetical protein|nr:putative phage abortive infection protein [Alistipes sp.]
MDIDGKHKKIDRLNGLSWGMIAIIITLIVMSLALLSWDRYRIVDFVQTGPIADTISDIVGPLISIASVSMMFLAFYIQYRANKLVVKQFDYNQFEHRFFELFRIHKENSNDVVNSFSNSRASTYQHTTQGIKRRKEFEYFVSHINLEYTNQRALPEYMAETDMEILGRVWGANQDENFDQYYRHLFLLVRFVVSRDFLSYEQKRSYLRIVRASLSVHEQVLLYYNWLAGDGRKWEDGSNHFFTDYRMVHNINSRLVIPDFAPKSISPFRELLLHENYMKEDWRTDDPLFETERPTRG